MDDLAEIIRYAGVITAAELARRLGTQDNYFTVAKAVLRIKRGLACQLSWIPCTGGLIAGPWGRTVHPACERQRIVRWGREKRRQRPGQSTPYVRRYRREHPDAARELREREKAKLREQWPSLPRDVREAARPHWPRSMRLTAETTP